MSEERIIKVKLPFDEKSIVNFITNRKDSARQGSQRQRFISNFETYRRSYKGEFKNKLPKQYSQYFVRIAFWTVDTIMSYFYEALFNNYPLARFVGRKEGDEEQGNAMQYVMDYEIYKRNFIDRSLTALNWVLKYGVNVTSSYWRYQIGTRKVRKWMPIAPGIPPLQKIEDERYVKWDDPYFDIIDPRRFYCDPNAGSQKTDNGLSVNARYAMHDEFVDFASLVREQIVKEFFNLDKVYADGDAIVMADSDLLPSPLNASEEDIPDEYRRRVKLTHYWGPMDLRIGQTNPNIYVPKEYDSQIYHVIIANDSHVIHLQPNVYHHGEMPYEIGNIYKDDDSIYGMSAIETVLTEENVLNTLINLRLDNIHNLVNPSIIAWRDGLSDKNILQHKAPGEPIYVKIPENLDNIIRPWPQPDIGADSFMQAFQHFETMAEKKSAANPYNVGFSAKSRRTATEVAQVSGSGTVRFKKMSFVYSNTWVQPLLRQFVQLVQQFSTEVRDGLILGDTGAKIKQYTPEEISGEYNIEVQDSTVTNKELVSQAYTNLLVGLQPWFQDGTLDKVEALKGILQNMPLIKNPGKLIKPAVSLTPEQIATIQQVMGPQLFQQIMMMRGNSAMPQNDGMVRMGPGQGMQNIQGGS